MGTSTVTTFSTVDYLVFALSLLISAGIGVYYACTGGKQKTTKEFLMGNRQMNLFPVTMSLVASFVSAISVLGVPSETYRFGTMYWMLIFAFIPAMVLTAHVYLPIFFRLHITSAYEYLEKRFNRKIRLMGTSVFILSMFLYMAVVLYTPALALSQVTGMSIAAAVLSSGLICTFYTSIGGMKAVMWTDTFQMSIIVIGTIIVIIKSTVEMGGLSNVWSIAYEGQRIEFFNFDPDPTVRHTQWSLWIGGTIFILNLYGTNQATVQRYMSVSSLKQAQLTCYLMAPSWISVQFLFVIVGIVMYAKYAECDPIQDGQINKPDQLFPLFVMQTLGFAKGLPGLFVASVYSAALSTVSSGVNSLSAVVLVDMLKPLYFYREGHIMPEHMATLISKILAAVFGVTTIGLAFLTSAFGDAVLSIAISLFGMVSGPLTGLFTMAIFFPIANSWGAATGLVSSLVIVIWIGIGTIFSGLVPTPLSLSIEGCASNASLLFNATRDFISTDINTSATTEAILTTSDLLTIGSTACAVPSDDSEPLWIFKISYMWYTFVAVVVCCVVGLLVSCVTGGPKEDLDPQLCVFPFTKVSFCTPKSWKSGKNKHQYNVVPTNVDGTTNSKEKQSLSAV